MQYTFELLGISPVLHFFNQQQKLQGEDNLNVEYLGNRKCSLDLFLKSVETISSQRSWRPDKVVETVINFWMNNPDSVQYWNSRLKDAGEDNLLVARVGDIKSLRKSFELLLNN
ncbi:MAG: hypothetical protein O4861_23790 [Trichodesmium sp. St16_bin4-tuft]|nr:hypothetical protein [Trichodesmium sp. MAG_R01]MDE5071801.1 hypothetical protein [Trichodesmium sp. St5_bin8]MDE5077036.1 hypothetical protein [Trichodesmium sp. St2_bin6]MDE5101188.1 hypothetical protein [Trichodesmium sp. St16_bin4-tuft]MDE5103597.1 hypothetical protein [Trichodesmium sp. St19_bin2]